MDMASLESRLKPEGGLQQASRAEDDNESGSDEDHRMTFVGNKYQSQQGGRSLAAEPQVRSWHRLQAVLQSDLELLNNLK